MPQERKKSRAEIPDDYQPLAGSTRPPVRGARLLGPVDPADRVTVTVLVRRRPGTAPLPDHHHWEVAPPGQRETLGVGEFTRRYGAAEEELDAVADFLASHGLTIHERHAGRSRVVAEGSAEEVGAAFGVALGRYEAPRRPLRRGVKRADGRALPDPGDDTQAYRGFEGEVHLPPHLHDVVTAVIGLDNRKLGAPAGTGDPSGASPLPPTSVASLYNLPNTGAAGQTIGLFAAADEGAAFLPSDITEFINSLPAGYQTQPNVTAIGLTVNGTTYTNDTSIILSGTAGDSAYEITQDISTSAAVAQGCNINVYMTEGSEGGWEAFLNRAIVPDAGDNPPSVLSASWVMTLSDDSGTIGDPSNSGSMASVLDGLLQKAAARLITVFLPIGDWGADDADPDTHCHVAFPNSDPWATSCGGTIIGTVSGTPPNWDEWVWSDAFSSSSSPFGSPTADFGATGGGVSDTFPVPSWQTSAGVNQKSKNDDKVRRGLPDITGMVALTGFFLNGGGYAFTGTSCVAPLYAGMTACLNSALGQPVGFLNPTIYANATEICRDITHGNNDSGDTPDSLYYTAAVGWDACSGWGTVDGTKLLTTLIDTTVTQTFQFWVIKSTFGVDEVTDTKAWPNSFSLVLDGFAPYQVGTPVPAVGFSGAFFNLPGVSIALDPSGPRWQDPSLTYTPQRLEIPFDVTFTNASLTAFPSTGFAPVEQLLTGLITVAGQTIAAQTVFELVSGADPYFTNIDASADNVFWLSQDLRVFTATPGIDDTPVAGMGTLPTLTPTSTTALDAAAGYSYVQQLIGYLNTYYTDADGPDPMATILPDQTGALSGDSSVTPSTPNLHGQPFSNYNFAIARVRLRGGTGTSSPNVRVFFRLFLTQTNDTDYQPATTYLSTLDAAGLPAAPEVGSGDETIPFFATGSVATETDYVPSGVNNQTISISSGDSTWAYFGCFLNVYDPSNLVDGKPVQQYLVGSHHCLVAQIAYDDASIENSNGVTESPENSDKLAQRNLQVTTSGNPAPAAGHRVPQTFDLRPSPSPAIMPGKIAGGPDELMIDWGATPPGSPASIYWPQLDAAAVIALADALYTVHPLTASDPHTLQIPVTDGNSYIPIPAGTGQNIAGLFTVDLPTTVLVGQQFNIVVRRFAYRTVDGDQRTSITRATSGRTTQRTVENWRYAIGTFQVKIPVGTERTLLPLEQDTLAVLKWRLEQMEPSNRWYPVLTRYVNYVSARVNAFGGNAASVPASLSGFVPVVRRPPLTGQGHVGKVSGILYDRFGDFDGFTLLSEAGETREYRSTEREIEALVRFVWLDRVVIEVRATEHEPAVPASITLLRSPRRVHF